LRAASSIPAFAPDLCPNIYLPANENKPQSHRNRSRDQGDRLYLFRTTAYNYGDAAHVDPNPPRIERANRRERHIAKGHSSENTTRKFRTTTHLCYCWICLGRSQPKTKLALVSTSIERMAMASVFIV